MNIAQTRASIPAQRTIGYSRRFSSRTTFVNPLEVKAIVPYGSVEQAEECAKIIRYYCKKYFDCGRDSIYDFDDYVMQAYEGILVQKRSFDRKGELLTPYRCRGYIKGYARKEVRRRQLQKKYKISFIFDINDADFIGENDECQSIDKTAALNYFSSAAPHLAAFASDFFKFKGDGKLLKDKYGSCFAKFKKKFFEAAKRFDRAYPLSDD